MYAAPLYLRIFISSPGDVAAERALVTRLIDQLPYDPLLRDKVAFRIIAWDKPGADTPLLASMTPQEAINKGLPNPSDCDIVIVVLWSRMGTPLPFPDYQKADGTRYVSGTEWEYLDAIRGNAEHGRPEVIVYRRMPPAAVLPDDKERDEKNKQYDRVEEFFRGFRDSTGESLLRGYNTYGDLDDFSQKVETHLKVILERLLDKQEKGLEEEHPPPLPTWKGSPFPGLRAFTTLDAPIFFGRTRETAELIRRVAEKPLVGVIGASGSGKSSLVAAGLVAALAANAVPGSKAWLLPQAVQRDRALWEQLRMTPGEFDGDPFAAFAAAIQPILDHPPNDLDTQLRTNPSSITDWGAALARGKPKWWRVLIFVDQLEELFTIASRADVEPFLALMDLTAHTVPFQIVTTLRADFYAAALRYPVLKTMINDASLSLGAPTMQALRAMIERPAARAGLTFEEGLVDEILEKFDENTDALPLLSFALDELYRTRAEGSSELTRAAYEEFGGIEGVIGKRAESCFRSLDDEAQNALDAVFARLVTVNDDGTPVRNHVRVALFDAIPGANTLIKKLEEARLFVLGSGADNEPTVTIAHEALFTAWDRLQTWLVRNREVLLWRRSFVAAVNAWKDQCADDFLYRGLQLEIARKNIANLSTPLDVDERTFYDRCVELERRYRRQRRAFQIALVAIPVLISLIAIVVLVQQERVKQSARGAERFYDTSGSVKVGERGTPSQIMAVDAFYIDIYEVTLRQYRLCVDAGACLMPLEDGITARYASADGNQPVSSVTAYQAAQFCHWIGRRLPTKLEWERTYRGTDGRIYPWNNDGTPEQNAYMGQEYGVELAAVDDPHYTAGANPEGVMHLLGNVSEWTATALADPTQCGDPYLCGVTWDEQTMVNWLMIQGLSYQTPFLDVPTDYAVAIPWSPIAFSGEIGFRCARDG